MTKIALIEDDADIAFTVRLNLERENYRVAHYADGHEGLVAVQSGGFDFVILDLNLPDVDGLTICRELRRDPATKSVPILMLTARGSERDRITGLELGADDYLTKPFSPRTLVARIRAVLRRTGVEAAAPTAAGRVRVDADEHTVQIGDAPPVILTKLELRLLQALLARAGHSVSAERLLMHVWGRRNSGDRQLLKQLVHRLRQKIEPNPAEPQILQTAAGSGYKLVVE